MFKRLFATGPGLTAEEKSVLVKKIGEKFEADNLSEATIGRFCVAREWKEAAIVTMLEDHTEWRRATLPIERTPAIDRVLDSGRIRVLRRGQEPLVAVDFMGGQFLCDDFNEDDIVASMCYVLEDVLAEADAASPADQPAQYIALNTGGPPPTAFIKKISPIFEVNYPERCCKGVIYPIPKWAKYIAKAILLLLPKRTRDKFIMLSEEAELCETCGLSAGDLPEDLKGGIDRDQIGVGMGSPGSGPLGAQRDPMGGDPMGGGTLGSPRDGRGPGPPMGGEPLGAQGIPWEGTLRPPHWEPSNSLGGRGFCQILWGGGILANSFALAGILANSLGGGDSGVGWGL